ncbi:MAG TPA: hypothetical protein VF017_10200 [Thermoanaerobaculia bacterium]|nr:hypothetical protein [Thermoanaerobaculia bacterium]
MSEDSRLTPLAQALRAREREESERLDERWDRLAAGELSPAEEAELAALAETSPEMRAAWDAFRPLGPDFEARMAARLGAGTESVARPSPPAAPPAPGPLRASRRPWGRWAAVAAALVAAVALYLGRTPPLPAEWARYEVELAGGRVDLRGGPEEASVPTFGPGSVLSVTLRPPTALDEVPEARLFLERQGNFQPWPTPLTALSQGVLHLGTPIEGEVAPEPGEYRLWAVIGRPGRLPSASELSALPGASHFGGRHWIAWRKEIRFVDEP